MLYVHGSSCVGLFSLWTPRYPARIWQWLTFYKHTTSAHPIKTPTQPKSQPGGRGRNTSGEGALVPGWSRGLERRRWSLETLLQPGGTFWCTSPFLPHDLHGHFNREQGTDASIFWLKAIHHWVHQYFTHTHGSADASVFRPLPVWLPSCCCCLSGANNWSVAPTEETRRFQSYP